MTSIAWIIVSLHHRADPAAEVEPSKIPARDSGPARPARTSGQFDSSPRSTTGRATFDLLMELPRVDVCGLDFLHGHSVIPPRFDARPPRFPPRRQGRPRAKSHTWPKIEKPEKPCPASGLTAC